MLLFQSEVAEACCTFQMGPSQLETVMRVTPFKIHRLALTHARSHTPTRTYSCALFILVFLLTADLFKGHLQLAVAKLDVFKVVPASKVNVQRKQPRVNVL